MPTNEAVKMKALLNS